MFGRRGGMGVKTGVSLVAALVVASGVTMTGCKGCKPKPPPETAQQKAEKLIAKAKEDLAKATTEADLDDVAAVVEEAKTTFSAVEGAQEVLDEVAAKRKAIADKAAIADLLAKAGAACDAKEWDKCIELCDQVLAKDPGNAKADSLKERAKIGKATAVAGVGEAQTKKYRALSTKIDAAIRSRNFPSAKRMIRELEPLVSAKLRLPSRMGEMDKIDAMEIYDRVKGRATSSSVPTLKSVLASLQSAERKDPTNRDVRRLKDRVSSRIRELEGGKDYSRRFNAKMREGESQERRKDWRRAYQSFQDALRLARGQRNRGDIGRAERKANNARKQMDAERYLSQAKQAFTMGRYAEAKRYFESARRAIYTQEAVDGIRKCDGKIAEKKGDDARAAKDWVTAEACFAKADSCGIDVAVKLAEARKMRAAEGDKTVIANAEKMGKALKWASVDTAQIQKLADAGNKDAQRLMNVYPLRAEAAKIDKAAVKPYKDLLAKLKKFKRDAHTAKIAAIRDAIPSFGASKKYRGLANNMIKKENDQLFRGKFTQVSKRAAGFKPNQIDDKIAYLQGELPQFKDTSYFKSIEGMIGKAKTTKAAGAFKTQITAINKFRDPKKQIDQKIAAIQTALAMPVFAKTTYEKKLQGMLTAAKNTKAAGAYADANKKISKFRDPKQRELKIAAIKEAQANPVFKGTRYEGMLASALKKELDAKARPAFTALTKKIARMKPDAKMVALTEAAGQEIYVGTSTLDRIKGMINSTKTAKLAKDYAADNGRIRKLIGSQAKIAAWQMVLPKYGGTKFEKTIKSSIDREKDVDAGKRYKAMITRINKMKPQDQIRRLQQAQIEFASSKRYKGLVDKQLKAKEAGLEKSVYSDILKAVGKVKKSAQKVDILERRKGELKSATYTKLIDAQIKKYKGLIQREAEAEKDKVLRSAYTALTKKLATTKKSADKVSLLQREKDKFIGSSFAKSIDAQIKKYQGLIAREAKAEKEALAKKVLTDVLKKLKRAKTQADCDNNIALLQEAKLKVPGTSVVRTLDAKIKAETALKKKLAPKPPR